MHYFFFNLLLFDQNDPQRQVPGAHMVDPVAVLLLLRRLFSDNSLTALSLVFNNFNRSDQDQDRSHLSKTFSF